MLWENLNNEGSSVKNARGGLKKRVVSDPNIYKRRHGESESNLAYRLLVHLHHLSNANNKLSIYNLAKSPLLPNYFKALYEQKNYYHTPGITEHCAPENYTYWVLGLFYNCRAELKKFSNARLRFNISLLQSDMKSASEALDEVESISHCWWATENRIHLHKELSKEPTKELINNITERFSNHNVSGKVRDLMLMSESGTISVFTNILDAQLAEYRSSGLKKVISYGAVLSCTQLPPTLDPEREITLRESFVYRNESILDQYVLYKAILSEMHINGIKPDKLTYELTANLASELQDDELSSLIDGFSELDESVLTVVRNYTLGRYEEVIKNISESMSENSKRIFGLIEIYARSKIYKEDNTEKYLYDKFANALGAIYMLKPNSDERIEYLKKICVKFRNEIWAKSLLFHLTNILSEIEGAHAVTVSKKATIALGRWNTPKALENSGACDFMASIDLSSVPMERAIRHGYENSTGDLIKANFPIAADYIKTQSLRHLERGELSKLINFSIDSYFNNKFSSYYLPMTEICRGVMETAPTENNEYISSMIVLDIYNKEAGSAYEEFKTELFVDLLDANGVHRPTSLFLDKELTDYDKYFLSNICVPSQLDNITGFKNNDEVIHERIAILDMLINSSQESADELKLERDKVLETLFSDKLRAKLESGKLFVDVQALEIQRKHFYLKLYEQAKSIEGGVVLGSPSGEPSLESTDILEIASDESGLPVAVSSNKKTSVIYKIFNSMARDFSLNENYGLDKYLSAEIRHTVFVTQIRACFERSHLITVEKNGAYLPNRHWSERYSYVTIDTVQEIDELLKIFSRNIDSILKEINNYFRVDVDGSNKEILFDFSSYYSRLVDISKILEHSENFQGFFNSLIGYMWALAAEHAVQAQNLINDELKPRILQEITSLENNIVEAKGVAPMGELMQEIRNCRSNFSNNLELVLNWFRFVGSEGVESFESLGVVIEASVASFISIYGHKGAEIAFTQQKSDLILNYRESRSLFIALFTAIENAVKYRTANSIVTISHIVYESSNSIHVCNEIELAAFGNTEEFICYHKAKWNDGHSNLSRQEGGSGIYKVYNLLHNSSDGFECDISIVANKFHSIMRLQNEYFSDRR